MRPIRVQKVCPHVGHKRVGVVVAICAAQSLRTALFHCALVMCLISATLAPVLILLCQVEWSRASVSYVLVSTPIFLRDSLRQSLYRFFCPLTERLLRLSSPYSCCLGNRLSGIMTTCPAHLAWAFSRRV